MEASNEWLRERWRDEKKERTHSPVPDVKVHGGGEIHEFQEQRKSAPVSPQPSQPQAQHAEHRPVLDDTVLYEEPTTGTRGYFTAKEG
jgi:hypothetical protein